jgi:membrane fusion protein, multidrug efflux system
VTAITIEPRTLPVTFEAVGQTEGSREVEVRSRVGGILLRRFYTEGSWVKRGTPLFKIDPAPYEAALNKLTGTLAQEEAQLDKAKRDEARLKPLFAENAVSRKDYEDAVSARETATPEFSRPAPASPKRSSISTTQTFRRRSTVLPAAPRNPRAAW